MVDAVYVVDDELNVEYMNPVMIKNFGHGIGKKCFQVLHDREEICSWCKAPEVFGGTSVRWEQRFALQHKTYDLIEFPLKNSDGTTSKVSIFRDITERRRIEERIKASEEDYRRLFENVGCGVYMSTKEGKFLNANHTLVEMLGYASKEEFLEIDITRDLYVRPEDRRKFQEIIERDGRIIDYEVEFKRKDGSIVSVLHTAQARYDEEGRVLGYEGINVDQSERKRMERELREAHDFLNEIVRSSPNAIMAADMKGNIIIWNRAAEEILGYKAAEVLGKINITEIYPEGMAKEIMRKLRGPGYGGIGRLNSYPVVYVRRDGVVVEGNLAAALIYDGQQREIASVGIFVDLKERLEMEHKLRDTQEQLLQSEKLAAMGKLTSQIAHELNNPLYGIMNTLELLKTEVSPQNKRRKILEMALSETERVAELLSKMLSFSKPDEEAKQPVDINVIVNEILLLVRRQLQENSIAVSSSFGDGLRKVYASKNQLRQVFLNMISNARDAMPDGGTLRIETAEDGDDVHIRITDSGVGIREEDISRIFEAFFTTKDSIKGVGLGLSVCYGFIKEHGGDIKVSTQRGSGTTFTITLPVCE
ncbi:MAG: PAS domain S-box protein [Desulfobacterales bacterium]|nr:MAG: PAS domain S-box protein [Desulfobacterales bacterium]